MPRKKNTAKTGSKRKATGSKSKRKPSKTQVKKFGRFLHEKFKTEE